MIRFFQCRKYRQVSNVDFLNVGFWSKAKIQHSRNLLPIFIGISRILKFSVISKKSSKAVGHRSGLPSIPNSTDFLT